MQHLAFAFLLLALLLVSLVASSKVTSAVMLAGPVAEQVLLLENIGTSIKVGPTQLASLHNLLLQAATTLQMEHTPDLYVRQHPVPNAYTLAIAGRKPFVVVHTALLELLELNEVQVQRSPIMPAKVKC